MSVSSSQRLWWWLIPPLLVMFWLGIRALNADPLWGDEYFSLYDSGSAVFGPLSPAEIWGRVAERNPWHTPGYFVLLSFWGRLAGWSVFSARGLSLLIGVLAVAWVFRLGRDLLSPRAGLYAAIAMMTSAFFIHYLHEIRMYTLMILLAAFVTWMYLRIVGRRATPTSLEWLGLFVGVLAMLYTHYFTVLPLGAIGLYHLLVASRRLRAGALEPRRWWGVVAVVVLAGLLFLPWFAQLSEVVAKSTRFEERNTSDNVTDTLELIGLGMNAFSNGVLLLLGAASVLAASALRDRQMAQRGVRLVWFFLIAVLLTFSAVNVVLDVTHTGRLRYMITLWPFLALIVGLALDRLTRLTGMRAALLALGVWVLIGLWSNETGRVTAGMDGSLQFYPMQTVARAMRDYAQPGDTVINLLPDGVGEWQYGGVADYYFYSQNLDFRIVEKRRTAENQVRHYTRTLDSLTDKQRLWLAYFPGMTTSIRGEFEARLRENYHACGERTYGDTAMTLYARSEVCCWMGEDGKPPRIAYGGLMSLTDAAPLPETVEAQLALTIGWWQSTDVPPNTYSIGLHVVDQDGVLAAQSDSGLPYQRFVCQPVQIDLAGLPAGDYELFAVVYRWQDGVRLVGASDDGQSGERVSLGRFRVEGDS